MNNIWRAIDREASSAAEHLAIGVTILGKANYAEIAYYGQAFFALSTGFERASKLIIAIDYSLVNGGEFPPNKIIRSYKHDLSALLIKADEIAGRHHVKRRLPDSVIHKNIITLLTQFADNITRYYNLDLITGDPKTIEQVDPIAAWFDQVILPIFNMHVTDKRKTKIQENANLIADHLEKYSIVFHHNEKGDEIRKVKDASFHTGVTDASKPYLRTYVMQIVRFIGAIFSKLGLLAYQSGNVSIPHLSDYFAIFNNDDRYFRKRKTWSIYKP